MCAQLVSSRLDAAARVVTPNRNGLLRSPWKMDRRSFVRGCCILSIPSAVVAQSTKLRLIGVLSSLPEPSPAELKDAWQPLRKYGWIEGRDFVVERRYAAGDSTRLRAFAQQLARLHPDVILCHGTEATIAAKETTASIPIVMFMVGDPMGSGLVQSLARPGGNVTGLSATFPELDAKRASLLRELIPRIERVTVLFSPRNPLFTRNRAASETAYRALKINATYTEISSSDQIGQAIAEAKRDGQALIVLPDPMLYQNMTSILETAERLAIPVVVSGKETVEAGALFAYDSSSSDQEDRVSAIVDKILRGTSPADIPVEQPSKFELTINVKRAQSLGITVPESVLLRADYIVR